jgi:formamidopyrimidine-DNA glycosylase
MNSFKNSISSPVKSNEIVESVIMPELPELEAFKTYVKKNALNKKISHVDVDSKNLIKKITFGDFKKALLQKKFTDVDRKGKFLIIHINDSPLKLIIHFGLTGTFIFTKKKNQKVKYSQVTFIFLDDEALHWINKRKFGAVWLLKNINEIDEIKDLGPDPLSLTKKQFLILLEEHKTKNIKTFFMDQSIIAGIGNEYADEILFQAGIDPHHTIEDLTNKQREKLYDTMNSVLKYAIKLRKNNIQHMGVIDFFSKEDKKTFDSSYLQAHRNTDNLCPKNSDHTLKKVSIDSRTTFYCPEDQK